MIARVSIWWSVLPWDRGVVYGWRMGSDICHCLSGIAEMRGKMCLVGREGRSADGGDGTYAGWLCWWIHCASCGRFCHATEWDWRECRSSWSCLSNKDVGYAEANWQVGSVSFFSSFVDAAKFVFRPSFSPCWFWMISEIPQLLVQ